MCIMNAKLCTNILQLDKPKVSLMYFYWNNVMHHTKTHHIYTQLYLPAEVRGITNGMKNDAKTTVVKWFTAAGTDQQADTAGHSQ